ncbi:unnamed protein product, partial [Medioppia subpectinata]
MASIMRGEHRCSGPRTGVKRKVVILDPMEAPMGPPPQRRLMMGRVSPMQTVPSM